MQKFLSTLKAGLLDTGSRLLVAVSGGLDSMVLLHLLLEVRDTLQLELATVHVHHGIRGEAADQDERLVRDAAKAYGLPYYCIHVDAVAHAQKYKLSLEESARVLRYGYFEEVLDETGFDLLAMAHTADDQAETVIDHFLRGSGSAGLRGIPVQRGRFVRPLLSFRRTELEQLARHVDLSFREDASNQDIRFTRNRIRHELLPYLKDHFNPNITAALNRSASVFGEVETFLRQCAIDAFKSLVSLQKKNEIILEIDGFLEYNTVVQKYVLLLCCEQLGMSRSSLDYDSHRNILQLIRRRRIGTRFDVTQRFCIQVDHDGIVIYDRHQKTPPEVSINLSEKSTFRFGEYEFRWAELQDCPGFSRSRDIEYFDRDEVGDCLKIRLFYPGAFFYPLNFRGKKKVSDFFSDCKVPLHARREIPLLESNRGILWICGYRMDDRFKVTDKTRTLLKVEIRKRANDD